MPNFPMQEYLEASRKQYERENYNPLKSALGGLASGVGQGMVKGVDDRRTEQVATQKGQTDMRRTLLTDSLKDNMIVDKATGKPIDGAIEYVVTNMKLPPNTTLVPIPKQGDKTTVLGPTGTDVRGTYDSKVQFAKDAEVPKISPLDKIREEGRLKAEVGEEASYKRERGKNKAESEKEYIYRKTTIPSFSKKLEEVLELNEDSYAGAFGGMGYSLSSSLNSDNPKFKNTAEVINRMQGAVAELLKKTFGGQLSEGEREYLNGVMGALPNLSKVQRRIAIRNTIDKMKRSLDSAREEFKEYGGLSNTTESGVSNSGDIQNNEQSSGLSVGTVDNGYRFLGGNPADPNSWEEAR